MASSPGHDSSRLGGLAECFERRDEGRGREGLRLGQKVEKRGREKESGGRAIPQEGRRGDDGRDS